MQLYLAGPLGFSEAGRAFYYESVIPRVLSLGHRVLDPWKLTSQREISQVTRQPYGVGKRNAWRRLNPKMAERNRQALDRCDGVFAILDGTDVDSGTAAEIGYAYAIGKPILGYRGDFRLSSDNEGSTVNLQVEYFICASGGKIISTLKGLEKGLAQLEKRTTVLSNPSGHKSGLRG